MGNRIRIIREQRGLSQAALGERVGLTKMQVSRNERGIQVPDMDRLYAYARALECHPAELMDDAVAIERDELRIIRIYRALQANERSMIDRMIQGLAHDAVPPANNIDARDNGGAHRHSVGRR